MCLDLVLESQQSFLFRTFFDPRFDLIPALDTPKDILCSGIFVSWEAWGSSWGGGGGGQVEVIE